MIPSLDLAHLDRAALHEACRCGGIFYLSGHGVPEMLCRRVLDMSRRFFGLPESTKKEIDIRNSRHFRGYSVMKNSRDWREQLHFGRELPPDEGAIDYRRLNGPNLWPESLGPEWRETMLDFLERTGNVGRRLLGALDLPVDTGADPSYLLMKVICYHPQPAGPGNRPGVAAHCDWSWITLLHQDDAGGLEVRLPDGNWVGVPPREGCFPVNIGELAEIATGGAWPATPHRVVNRSPERVRISLPVFINPPLGAWVKRERAFDTGQESGEHVHRVRPPSEDWPEFSFGESEWRRKALGRWCWRQECSGVVSKE